MKKHMILLMAGLLSAGALAACSSVSEDGEWKAPAEGEPAQAGAGVNADGTEVELGVAQQAVLSGVHKVCSVFTPGKWRDTILVPDGWTRTNCTTNFRSFVSATEARVGCLLDGRISLATCSVCLPPTNSCGWQ